MKFSKRKKKKSLAKKIRRILFILIILLIIVIFCGGIYFYSKIEDDLKESIDKGNEIISEMSDNDFNSRTPTNIYDKDGNLIKQLKTVDYIYKTYDEINPNVFKAVIAVEDSRFYEHDGIDFKGLTRAMYSSIVRHQKQGGSTITQQLAKNVYLSMEQTIWRKITEAVIAQELENRYTKHQILEFYVNNINYGNGCYSIESAANYYFSKNTNDLTLAEIALLTGIPNNPTTYNPLTKFENACKRKNSILKKMYNQNMISEKEYNDAKNQEIILNINEAELNNAVTDYAQSYAIHESVEFLMSYYGFQFKYDFKDDDERNTYWKYYNSEYKKYYSELISGGYDIYTSINPEIQNMLQDIVNRKMSKYTTINDSTGIYEKQASATIIDNNTGLVIGIIGGRTQDNVDNSYNRAFLAARQPGSTIKPIIVYTPAIENGYNAESKLVDEAIPNGPKNSYKGYVGTVNLRTAVSKSINTIAYKLTQEIGIENSLSYLVNMKYKYLSPADKQSKTIGLGGFTYGSTSVEMASAYSTLARNGKYIDTTNITKIYDRTSKTTIYENTYETKKIYDDGAAYLMTDVLKTVVESGTGKSFRLSNMNEQAGKTGTTNSKRDLWFCGYTPSYTMSVWVGDDTPKEQNNVTEQGKIWNEMMTILNEGKSDETFERPDSVYEEHGVLKYKKVKNDNILEQNQEQESERIKAEETLIKSFKYKNNTTIQAYDELLIAYTDLLNNYKLSDTKDFPIISKYIENGDKIKGKVSDSKLIKNYESAKTKIKKRVQLMKDKYEQNIVNEEESQKDSIWNNILNDFYNRKPDIVIPNQNENIIQQPNNNDDDENDDENDDLDNDNQDNNNSQNQNRQTNTQSNHQN